jgi:hypothetical protein
MCSLLARGRIPALRIRTRPDTFLNAFYNGFILKLNPVKVAARAFG